MANVDGRGYKGAEKNRLITPEQVVWARNQHFKGASAPEIVKALQRAGVWMSVDSVRKMLRGDTYANVGVKLPEVEEAPKAVPTELVDDMLEKQKTDGTFERLMEAQREADAKARAARPEPFDPAVLLRKLGQDIATERARDPDTLLGELAGEDPFAEPGDTQ